MTASGGAARDRGAVEASAGSDTVVADAEAPSVVGAVAGPEPERGGQVTPDAREEPGVVESGDDRLDRELLERLGVGPAPATLLQFSSAFCAPCRAVRRISADVATLLPGVQHVEVDAESHLAEVRQLGIWRTPTLLLLDADGRVAKRATGVPSKPQLIAALADVLPAGG
jgi:thiol-disulfide isomerase/thioredoxin